MKKFNLFLLLLTSVFTTSLNAQEYLEELYDVSAPQTVIYGANASILPVLADITEEAINLPLPMDVYLPEGDDNMDRPVMLVLHTGNFIPFPDNFGTGGTRSDSTVVETCKRLARRGYVACALDYRLGWNPVAPTEDLRKFFLINAAYRGVQDVRTAVRFLRKDATDGGDSYGIDPDKIGVWGIGTGGYIAAALGTLDDYAKIPALTKFLTDIGDGNGVQPMVKEARDGNIYGTSVGVLEDPYLGILPVGDTLCYPNHVTYADGSEISSDISFVVNNGGALGDISWLDENTPPWVSFHVPNDPFAPYTSAVLTVPGTGDPLDPSDDFAVMVVDGSYNIQQKMNTLGNNDIFDGILPSVVDYSEVADARNDGYNGLFPMPNNSLNNSAPWDFYADDIPTIPPNPISDPVLARTYWDTIFAYVAPRACLALELGCTVSSINDIDAAAVDFQLAPNPAGEYFRISSASDKPMVSAEIYDVTGRIAQSITIINNSEYVMDRNNLAPGLYYLKVNFIDGSLIQKLVLK